MPVPFLISFHQVIKRHSMRIETNEDLVKRNRRIATYLFFFSLFVLGFGFLAANGAFLNTVDESTGQQLYLLIMPVVLIVGMLSTLVSVRMTNLWVRQPRPEDSIQLGLKGISTKSVLYNYLHMPARHILISPQGVFAIITRYQEGKFAVDGGTWTTHRSPLSRVFSIFRMDGIGDPTTEAKAAAKHVQDIMDEIGIEVDVEPLILFIDPRSTLEITNPEVPVLFAMDKVTLGKKEVTLKPNLKQYLKGFNKDDYQTLTDEEIEKFENATIEFEIES